MNSIVLELSAFLAVSFFVVSMCNHCPPIQWKGVQPHTSVKNVNNETRVFTTVSGVDLNGCIDNCQRRGVCQYINYHTSAHVCFLIEPLSEPITEDNMVYDDTHFVFGNKSEWAEENWGQNYSVCRNCSERQMCTIEDDGTVNCTFNECPAPPVIDDAELLGNKYTIGSRLRYRCKTTKKSVGIVCQPNGTWATVDVTCRDSPVSDGTCVTTEPKECTTTTSEQKSPITNPDQEICIIGTLDLPIQNNWGTQCRFMIVENAVSKAVAMSSCTEGGGKLVQILNEYILNDLSSRLEDEGKHNDYWVDAERQHENSPWKTTTCQTVLDNKDYWHGGSRRGKGGGKKSATISRKNSATISRKNDQSSYKFQAWECENELIAFICEK